MGLPSSARALLTALVALLAGGMAVAVERLVILEIRPYGGGGTVRELLVTGGRSDITVAAQELLRTWVPAAGMLVALAVLATITALRRLPATRRWIVAGPFLAATPGLLPLTLLAFPPVHVPLLFVPLACAVRLHVCWWRRRDFARAASLSGRTFLPWRRSGRPANWLWESPRSRSRIDGTAVQGTSYRPPGAPGTTLEGASDRPIVS